MLHADLTLLLHTHQVADGACFLFTAYTRCMRKLPLLLRTSVAGGIAYPYGAWDCLCYCQLVSQRDCLPTLAFHVNVCALITPPPWSIVSLFRPPLQRSPSVVTVVTLASTYCSFPVCRDRQEFTESPVVRPERASLSFAVLLYLPPLWRAAYPRSESSVGTPVIICLLFHLPTFMARGPSGPAYHCLSAQLTPLWRAARPSIGPERALRRRPTYQLPFVSFTHLYGAGPEQASFSLPFCPIMARDPSGPAYHCLPVQFAPSWRTARARSERSVDSPVIICLFASFAHLYGALPERASFSLPFCPIPPPPPLLWRAARASQLFIAFCAICPGYVARPALGASVP